jgi:hypothetical protein
MPSVKALPFGNPAKFVDHRVPRRTTRITANHYKLDGSASGTTARLTAKKSDNMQLSLEHIEKELQAGELAPNTLADYRVFLAALYSWRASEMQDILVFKPTVWLEYRKQTKSVAEADRMWDATVNGKREIQLKWELRRIDKLSSAIATKLRIMESEARKQM